MNQWKKGFVHWKIKNTVYVSIPFTWLVKDVIKTIKKEWPKNKVIVGGPGALLMKDAFGNIAQVQETTDIFEPVIHHNPLATFTTRGCTKKCGFCFVPKGEGDFRELKNFIPRPVICDNNFTSSSKSHIKFVINKLKKFPYIDFNQGLEAKLFTTSIASEFQNLKNVNIRFAFDNIGYEKYVVDAIRLSKKKGFKNISCYLLFGFKDTPKDALHRAQVLRKEDIQIFPMRYQPLNTEQQDTYINMQKGWTDYELKRFKRYWRGRGLYGDTFESYDHRKIYRRKGGFFDLKEDREERWGNEK